MGYSVNPILHNYKDDNGLHKIIFQVIVNRHKVYVPTKFKVSSKQLDKGKVVDHPLKDKINKQLREQKIKLEDAVLDLPDKVTKAEINLAVKGTKGKKTVTDFVNELISERTGNFSDGTMRHYKSISNKMNEYQPDVLLADIDAKWLTGYEQWARGEGNSNNTINANIAKIKAFLNEAVNRKLIESGYAGSYKPPKKTQKIPEYLLENEIEDIYKLLQAVKKPSHQLAGYYFLLSCYAGYRISDLLRFDYGKMVFNGQITLRATKNKKIVSIPIYPKLKRILEKIKDKPLNLSEQKAREYMKEIVKMAGVARKVTPHTARHTFGMYLADKGFDLEEIAEFLGDTVQVARIYVRMSNARLKKLVNERLS